jgi:ubiquinone/menaquinone biosynthesis C-methylase UbiE
MLYGDTESGTIHAGPAIALTRSDRTGRGDPSCTPATLKDRLSISIAHRPHVLARPHPDHPDVAASTDEYAHRFAGPVGRWFLDVQNTFMLAALEGYGRPLRIVDVGGGHGQLAGPFSAAGHSVEVVGSTAQCAARLTRWIESGACTFRTASLLDLPYADCEFDVAVCIRTLVHISDWNRLIGELCRVARFGVIVDYATSQSLNILSEPLFEVKLKVERNTRRFRVFPRAQVQSAFEERGFAVKDVHPQFFLPMALHRAHGSAGLGRMLEGVPQHMGLTRRWGSPIILHAQRS